MEKITYINIYNDGLQVARLFGASVLYSTRPIPREDVPQGWYCYDLRGTVKEPEIPYALVDGAQEDENRLASVLSYLPLKNGRSRSRLIKGMFQLTGESVTLARFCDAERIRCPETPLCHKLRPASPDEAELFYALPPERDEELGTIGHVRIDFGGDGAEFHHTWWPRGPQELNTPEFQKELDKVVNDLRQSVLKGISSMRRYCRSHDGEITGGTCCQNYGYVLETNRYVFRLRCNPTPGDYQAYLSCFVNQKRGLGLTESGRRKLRDAADPNVPHTYDWYVMEGINTPEKRFACGLSLEDAIQRYATSEQADKRLGVTKDDIAAVDLLIRHDGREWLSEDWTKGDSFSNDPVVARVVARLRRAMEEGNHRP